MLCAAAAAGDAFLLPRRAREDRPGATSTRGAGERRSLPPPRAQSAGERSPGRPKRPTGGEEEEAEEEVDDENVDAADNDGLRAARCRALSASASLSKVAILFLR